MNRSKQFGRLPPGVGTSHPSDEQLESYSLVDPFFPGDEHVGVEVHLLFCPRCRDFVSEFDQRFADMLKLAMISLRGPAECYVVPKEGRGFSIIH